APALVDAAGRDIHPCGASDRRRVNRAVLVEVAVLCRQDSLGHVRAHLLNGQGYVIVARRAPVLDELAVAVLDDDVSGREHVLTRVRQVLYRPQHVEGRGEEECAHQGRDPGLLGPEPRNGTGQEHSTLRASSSERSGGRQETSSSATSTQRSQVSLYPG